MSLPEIPDEALDATRMIDPRTGHGPLSVTAVAALQAAWPHLYAAALRHAADELVRAGHRARGKSSRTEHATAQSLRRLAEEATQ